MARPVCAILGIGPGNGMALARRFDKAGHALGLCSRRGPEADDIAALGQARGYLCDVSDVESLSAALSAIRADLGPVETLIYNAGSAHWGDIDSLDADAVRRDLEVNAVGLFNAAKLVLPDMRGLGRGSIVVIGAGAALRGRSGTISFAAGKSAQRSVAQSLARLLGPENIHVGYIVLDGVVDLETTKARMPDKPDTFYLSAEGVAEAAFLLTEQDRQAWTFEMDLRPFAEEW